MRVILLKGRSAYEALRIFTDGLAAAFRARGYEVSVIDAPAEPDLPAALRRDAASGPVALVHSFTILGEWRGGDGRSVGEIVEAPHVIQYVDYPMTHMQRLDGTAAQSAILTIDPTHAEAIVSTYGEGRFAHVGFCPHAAVGEAAPPEADPDAFAAARPIPVLFAGTFYKAEDPLWLRQEARIKQIFDGALQLALAAEWMAPLDALDISMTAMGLDPKDPDLKGFRKNAFMVHEQVRTYRRFELLKAAARTGLPVHVYGKGYEKQLYRLKNVVWGGEADLNQVIALMRRARVVLSANANFGAGSHERPLTALLAGAAAATDHSRFYAERFEEGSEIFLYRWKSLDQDLARIGALAEDPEAAFGIARMGQARVLAEHGFDNRIDPILAAADAARPALRPAA
jgi:hypothetical protein